VRAHDDIDADDDDTEAVVEAAFPTVAVEPAEWTLEDVAVGCEQTLELTIRSVGTAPLTVHDWGFDSTSEELSLATVASGDLVLQPGQSVAVVIDYVPGDESVDTATLRVYSDDPVRPEATAEVTAWGDQAAPLVESFAAGEAASADILWVLDDSASMADDLALLGPNFDAFADQLVSEALDAHVGVVTTRDAVLRGEITVMTQETPALGAALSEAASVGTGGTGPSEGLRTALDALTPPNTDPGGPNEGFLRQEATLHVVFVTDGDDESPGGTIDYAGPLVQLKLNETKLFLHAVIAGAAPRYEDAASMTHGAVAEITDPAWYDELGKVSWIDGEPCDTFELEQVPLPGTLEVSINDTFVADGWVYDPDLNAVVFEPDAGPGHDDIVTVKYSPAAEC